MNASQRASAWRKALQPITTARVNTVARKLEPKLRRRFLQAVASMRGNVDLDLLAEALRTREAVAAISALHPETWGTTLQPMSEILPLAFRQAGQVAASLLASQMGISIGFNLTNPRAVQWARSQSSRLITDITESVREAIRQVITSGFTEGIAPRESARVLREMVGLTDQQAMAVINYRFRLLEEGRAAEDVARLGERYGKQLLNGRALNIARTETISSSTNGQQELWRQAVDRGLLDPDKTRREWIVTPDDRLAVVGPKTNILTREGWKPVSAVRVGDFVLTHKDRFCRVTRAEGKWYDGPTVMIHVGCAAIPRVHLTYGHPVLVRRDGANSWVHAENLLETDSVFINGVPCAECGGVIPSGPWYPSADNALCHACNVKKQNASPTMRHKQRAAVRAFNAKKWTASERAKASDRMRVLCRETDIVHHAMQGRGRKNYGQSWSERKVAWWLGQQGIAFEQQWMFRYGPKQGRGFADFYLPGPRVVLEVDGPTHVEPDVHARDMAKDLHLASLGVRVFRVSDTSVRADVGAAIGDLVRAACCIVAHPIRRVEHRSQKHSAVYHLTVEGDESFIAAGVVVHNCPQCEPMDGQTVGLEEPFTSEDGTSVLVPPLHPQCRCAIGLSFME